MKHEKFYCKIPDDWIVHNCKHSKDYGTKCYLILQKPNKKLRKAIEKGMQL